MIKTTKQVVCDCCCDPTKEAKEISLQFTVGENELVVPDICLCEKCSNELVLNGEFAIYPKTHLMAVLDRRYAKMKKKSSQQ